MSGLYAQLSPHEEVALRRVAMGASEGAQTAHIQRLHHLRLIEGDKAAWRITALGQQRLKAMRMLGTTGTPDEISRILEKFTKQRE